MHVFALESRNVPVIHRVHVVTEDEHVRQGEVQGVQVLFLLIVPIGH